MCKELVRDGWTLVKNRGKHPKLRKGSAMLSVPFTPGDHRTYLNFARDVRRQIRENA